MTHNKYIYAIIELQNFKLEMNIQTEVQKIHNKFGVTEKANYEIQKLFDKVIKEVVTEALCITPIYTQLK